MISAKLATQPSHTRSGSLEPESTMMTRPAEQSLQKIWPQRRQWCRRFQKLNSSGRPLLPPTDPGVQFKKPKMGRFGGGWKPHGEPWGIAWVAVTSISQTRNGRNVVRAPS